MIIEVLKIKTSRLQVADVHLDYARSVAIVATNSSNSSVISQDEPSNTHIF